MEISQEHMLIFHSGGVSEGFSVVPHTIAVVAKVQPIGKIVINGSIHLGSLLVKKEPYLEAISLYISIELVEGFLVLLDILSHPIRLNIRLWITL